MGFDGFMMSMVNLKYSVEVSWLVRGCARVISSDTGLGDRLPGLVGVVRYQGGRIPGMV